MIFKWIVSSFDLKIVIDDFLSLMLEILTKTGYVDLLNDITSCLNPHAVIRDSGEPLRLSNFLRLQPVGLFYSRKSFKMSPRSN